MNMEQARKQLDCIIHSIGGAQKREIKLIICLLGAVTESAGERDEA